ncbi:hypothetical protein HNQ60_000967 [Povalibacter uvarum]|uniref:Uncharacterized protein n=1 Tax=Povalibacter uvarum TaxID=732238 RepID=A0A841HG83_9GAMM|nr:hypothetical protein [Povalibacter uvarum]MBB6092121.1 hypothetical protein [Povalibacter uvarum]
MAPLLCVTYRNVEPLPQIEEGISKFAEDLVRVCDSITRCELLIGRSPSPASQGGTWFVRATLHVFEHSIGVVRFQPDLLDGGALRIALREILAQAATELSVISREHHGCGCGGQCEVASAPSVTSA